MAEVDPRFDPQFQRGYDPSVHKVPRRQRAAEPRVEERRDATRLETPQSVDAIAEADHPDEPSAASTADSDPEPPGTNPLRLALLLASLASIAAALGLLWQRVASQSYYNGVPSNQEDMFLANLIDAAVDPLLAGGLVGLLLWLGIGALRRLGR